MELDTMAAKTRMWKIDGQCSFQPAENMGEVRFQQLRPFGHLAKPELPFGSHCCVKVEPFGIGI